MANSQDAAIRSITASNRSTQANLDLVDIVVRVEYSERQAMHLLLDVHTFTLPERATGPLYDGYRIKLVQSAQASGFYSDLQWRSYWLDV